ncbi:MAG: hypothetical protein KIS91_01760 [Anaerolineae bacterium]|nr:hypothetical protein [Anaerolineae bacterium]
MPASYNYGRYSDYLGGGSQVAYGRCCTAKYNGWDAVYVQNLSRVYAAQGEGVLRGPQGGIVTTLVDWVCPRGEQTFLPAPWSTTCPASTWGPSRQRQTWITQRKPCPGLSPHRGGGRADTVQ